MWPASAARPMSLQMRADERAPLVVIFLQNLVLDLACCRVRHNSFFRESILGFIHQVDDGKLCQAIRLMKAFARF